ncbi:MAG: FmdE family protein [Thermodesulforhabdaceae bacterium]
MDRDEIKKYEGFEDCVDFHGHVCPGLSLGYKAARIGMEKLNEMRAEDEELVAIVENDSCFVDAVQVLTGCTFGKGNLIYKDYGKMAVTFASRKTGKGVRVSLRERAFRPQDRREHFELLQKVLNDTATDEERNRFWELHIERSRKVLESDPEEFFKIEEIKIDLPPKARIVPSEMCDECGEATMQTKMVERDGKKLCRACAERRD